LVGLALLLVSTLTFVQAQKGLEEQLAGVRLGAQFIDYDEEGGLKPDCLLAIYGMPDYIIGIGRGAAPAQPGLKPPTPPEVPGIPIAKERIEIPGQEGGKLRLGIPMISIPGISFEELRASLIQTALAMYRLTSFGSITPISQID
jgi:hypothetical protein